MLSKVESAIWKDTLQTTTKFGVFLFSWNGEKLILRNSLLRKLMNQFLTLLYILNTLSLAYNTITLSQSEFSYTIIAINIHSLIIVFVLAVARISYDWFAPETVALVNQIWRSSVVLEKIGTELSVPKNPLRDFRSKLLKATVISSWMSYVGIGIIYRNQLGFVPTLIAKYYNLGTPWSLFLFLLVVGPVQWDILFYYYFSTFLLLYVDAGTSFWLEQCNQFCMKAREYPSGEAFNEVARINRGCYILTRLSNIVIGSYLIPSYTFCINFVFAGAFFVLVRYGRDLDPITIMLFAVALLAVVVFVPTVLSNLAIVSAKSEKFLVQYRSNLAWSTRTLNPNQNRELAKVLSSLQPMTCELGTAYHFTFEFLLEYYDYVINTCVFALVTFA